MIIYDLLKNVAKQSNIKHSCININDYMDLLKDNEDLQLLKIMTHRDIVQTGHYATFFSVKIWCSADMLKNSIKISYKEKVSTKISSDWSPILSLSNGIEIERILQLKAFW